MLEFSKLMKLLQNTSYLLPLPLVRAWVATVNLSRVIALLMFFLFSLNLLSCSESRSFEERLESFYALLDSNSISAFQNGNLDTVVDFIKSKQTDVSFNVSYIEVKRLEAINLFSDKQVVEFFYENFYQKHQSE